MVDILFMFLGRIKFLILRNYWMSINTIENLRMPILFVTGDRDELVPHEMTMKLHEKANNSVFKKLVSNFTNRVFITRNYIVCDKEWNT